MPYVCSDCGTKVKMDAGRCEACAVEFAKNPPRNATADPEVVDEFPGITVWRVKGVTKRRMDPTDLYALEATRDALILIRTGEYQWLRSAMRDIKSTSLDIFGSAASSYYLNKPFMGSDMKDVTPRDAAGVPLPAILAFRADPKHNRMIPIETVASVGLLEVTGKKGRKSISARISYREGPSAIEAHALNIPLWDQYTSPRFKRLVTGMNVQLLDG